VVQATGSRSKGNKPERGAGVNQAELFSAAPTAADVDGFVRPVARVTG